MPDISRVFDHTLYRTEALSQTADAYSGHVSVSLEPQDAETQAVFSGESDDLTMLVDAFSNHALFLSIQAYREGSDA
jgi:hypothetical protein